MNVLAELSSDSDDSDVEEEAAKKEAAGSGGVGPGPAPAPAPPAKKQRRVEEPKLEDLQELGFVAPSILLAPEPRRAIPEGGDWAWGSGEGRGQGPGGAEEEEEEGPGTAVEREAMRGVGARVEEDARLARLTAQREARLRDEAREEHRRIAEQRRLTFKQKEKRKRDMGQAKGGKGNYVEEEKRVARNFGVYSGFDT